MHNQLAICTLQLCFLIVTTMTHFVRPPDELYVLVRSPRMISFVVSGNPVPKRRAGRTATGRMYNPDQRKQAEFASVAKAQFTEAMGSCPFFSSEKNLKMEIEFYIPITVQSSKAYERSLRSKGDVDNFAKFVQDALQGVLYDNDNQILHLDAKKTGLTGVETGRVRVHISVIEDTVV